MLLFTIMLVPMWGFSQETDLRFIDHLVKTDAFEEAVFLIDKSVIPENDTARRDSLLFLKGWSLYRLKQLRPSAKALQKVSESAPFYPKSHYFAAYNLTYTSHYKEAKTVLSNVKKYHKDLYHFQKAGLSLLQKDYEDFNTHLQKADTSFYAISKEAASLYSYAKTLREHRPKSPALAAVMSAVLPGSGKWYAGKKGQAITTFMTVAGFGLVTFENYNKRGIKDFRTMLFGALFAAFYSGNIIGSVSATKIAEQEFEHEYRNKILFDLHIPLRNIFN
jgi:tetratricopeptide (TPR) repeat protein